MASLELSKDQLPYNTEVIMEGFNNQEIYILKETEKALLMCYTTLVRRGTSMVSDRKEITFWCPKSVWFSDKYFENYGHNYDGINPVIFKAPYFLLK